MSEGRPDLSAYIEQMAVLQYTGDKEGAHIEADTILLKVVRELAGEQGAELARLYNVLDKWYA